MLRLFCFLISSFLIFFWFFLIFFRHIMISIFFHILFFYSYFLQICFYVYFLLGLLAFCYYFCNIILLYLVLHLCFFDNKLYYPFFYITKKNKHFFFHKTPSLSIKLEFSINFFASCLLIC